MIQHRRGGLCSHRQHTLLLLVTLPGPGPIPEEPLRKNPEPVWALGGNHSGHYRSARAALPGLDQTRPRRRTVWAVSASGTAAPSRPAAPRTVYAFSARPLAGGEPFNLSSLRGKVLLIENVASL